MTHIENLILGAGPAGLQAAYFLQARSQPYLVLDKSDHPGASFDRHPRHRKLLSINKRFTGYPDLESRRRYDWNSLLATEESPQFVDYTAEYFPDASVLPRYLQDFENHHSLEVTYGFDACRIARNGEGFLVQSADGRSYTCDKLFVATGLSKENVPDIEGVELCQTYDQAPVDPEEFTDRRVMVVGKGNSAFETAENIVSSSRKIWVCGPSAVRLAWATHFVGDLRAVNNNFLDTYQLKAQNNILDGQLKRVWRCPKTEELVAEVYFESRQRSYEYRCDNVILCTGFRFDPAIFEANCKPKMRHCGRLPLMSSEWESENIPNMFFLGTLMQSRDYRKTMSAFIHGFRHNIEALDQILQRRADGRWPAAEELPVDPSSAARMLIQRFSTSAALLLQPGFLADLVLVNKSESRLEYMRSVPVDYAMEHILPNHPLAYVATLEYRKQESMMDPFAMPRGVGVEEDFYIHPVLRRFELGVDTGKFFLPDDLDNDWREDEEHMSKLTASLLEEFTGEAQTAPLHSFVAELSPDRAAQSAKSG